MQNYSKETYEEMIKTLTEVDLTKIVELQDNTNLNDNIACGGPNGCEI